MKEKIDKLYFIKINKKKTSSVKDTVKKMKRKATDWKKIISKDTSDIQMYQDL
jgi:hypothetical protein